MKIFNNVAELIGNTPLVELKNIEKKYNLNARIIAKVEGLNPAGSAKDRVALNMINCAEEKGLIKKGATIIEPTSGNTGIGLALISLLRGYHAIIIMPDSMSVERQNLIKAYGAEVILTKGSLGMKGSIDKANELHKEIANSFIPSQFENLDNPKAHYLTTGPEIWRDTEGNVDIFVAGIGTGGTISGTSKYLKEQNKNVKAIGIEPLSSPVLTKGFSGAHKIQGIGANFVPNALDKSILDEVLDISDNDAITMTRELVRTEGIFAGISSGAAVYGAIEIAKREENFGKTIVVLLPDSGDRYLSSEAFNNK